MKKQPLPPTIRSAQWAAKENPSLAVALNTLLTSLTQGSGNESSDRSRNEATLLLQELNTKEGTELVQQIEALSDEALLARYVSLWAETAETSHAASNLNDAWAEAEIKALFQKDVTTVEIHRRALVNFPA